jgi:predicted DNA-binding transcriptional regulator AlpA
MARQPIPDAHADVALTDIKGACDLARVSASWMHARLRSDPNAPQPIRFGPRCTRYKLSEVRAWLARLVEQAAGDDETATMVKQRAKKGAEAARAKRLAAAVPA